MSFIYQFNSFLNLGACKEYSVMARAKSPTGGKQKDTITSNNAASVTPAANSEPAATEAPRPEARKLGVVKSDSRTNIVPINLEDEVRRRAYELYQQRGCMAGYETQDWLTAEREVMQRYRQQSA
jgi:hypothetical protein